MFKNKVIRYSTIAMVIAILAYFVIENFSSGNDPLAAVDPQQYKTQLQQEREAKDEQFKTGDDSPVADKEAFHGLHYFPANISYRVLAAVSPYMKDDKEMVVKYTDGTSEKYEKYGYANFKILGEDQKLLLLKNEGIISILFQDATSGKQTYGGGRYIDYPVADIKNNQMTIDFNKAYNPYCAYQESFACPVPPAENRLPVPIEAGELLESSAHE